MAEVIYRPARVAGGVQIPPSKSAAHRAALCRALRRTVHRVAGRCERRHARDARGSARWAPGFVENGVVRVAPGERPAHAVVDCGESARRCALIPVFARSASAAFIGRGRLPERPIGVYTALLPQHGVQVETAGGLPLKIRGRLQAANTACRATSARSSSRGCFWLPRLHGDSEIVLTAPLESKGYIDLTVEVLRGSAFRCGETPRGWLVPGGQAYRAPSYSVEGDWSQAAFFLSAAAVGGAGRPARPAARFRAGRPGVRRALAALRP